MFLLSWAPHFNRKCVGSPPANNNIMFENESFHGSHGGWCFLKTHGDVSILGCMLACLYDYILFLPSISPLKYHHLRWLLTTYPSLFPILNCFLFMEIRSFWEFFPQEGHRWFLNWMQYGGLPFFPSTVSSRTRGRDRCQDVQAREWYTPLENLSFLPTIMVESKN